MALATCLGCLFESTHLQNFPTEYHDEETPKKKKIHLDVRSILPP